MLNGLNITVFQLHDAAFRQQYDALFEDCAGAFVQQSTWWAEVIAELGPDTPFFLLASDGGVPVAGLSLYLYEHSLGNALVSVPQAGPLGGIFYRDGLSEDVIDACYEGLLQEAIALGRARDCISVSIITNPFRDDVSRYHTFFAPDYILENYTQSMNLWEYFDPNGIVCFPNYHSRTNLRRNLGKARQAALKVRFGVADSELDGLLALHVKRHEEIAAPPLDERLIRNIARRLLPQKKAFFTVVEGDSGIASWGIYLHHRDVVDVLRLNLNSEYARAGANFLNTDASLEYAHRLGVRTYNWQSSPSRDSGVYRYKQQWGAHESIYYFVIRLLCPVERLISIGVETLKREFPLHFVVPYDAAPNCFRPGVYRKQ